MSQENIFMHQVHDDAGAWSRAANREQHKQAERGETGEWRERGGQLERATSWKYFNEFMCLSNYGDKCLCINRQLAGWRSLSLPPLSCSLYPSYTLLTACSSTIYVLTSAGNVTTAGEQKKQKNCGQDINKFADFELGSLLLQLLLSKSRFTPHKVGIISFH